MYDNLTCVCDDCVTRAREAFVAKYGSLSPTYEDIEEAYLAEQADARNDDERLVF